MEGWRWVLFLEVPYSNGLVIEFCGWFLERSCVNDNNVKSFGYGKNFHRYRSNIKETSMIWWWWWWWYVHVSEKPPSKMVVSDLKSSWISSVLFVEQLIEVWIQPNLKKTLLWCRLKQGPKQNLHWNGWKQPSWKTGRFTIHWKFSGKCGFWWPQVLL